MIVIFQIVITSANAVIVIFKLVITTLTRKKTKQDIPYSRAELRDMVKAGILKNVEDPLEARKA